MNENKLICKVLRKEFSRVGWMLTALYGIMNLSLILVMAALWLVVYLTLLGNPNLSAAQLQLLDNAVMDNYSWGYTVAVLLMAIVLVWKQPRLCFKTIWKTQKPMSLRRFFMILPIFISGQAFYQLLTPLLEWLFGWMNISLADSVASATGSSDSLSMFLYVCLLAPIWEEVLFRGYVLRSLQPYGKKFAIVASAFLFGVFHGNVVQMPYAFAVGLVLGYVATEYSVVWAMVLHTINNLLLGDTMGRLLQYLPAVAQEIIFLVLIWGCTLAAVIILICKRKKVGMYFIKKKIHPLCLKSFFTSPGIVVFTILLLGVTTLLLLV